MLTMQPYLCCWNVSNQGVHYNAKQGMPTLPCWAVAGPCWTGRVQDLRCRQLHNPHRGTHNGKLCQQRKQDALYNWTQLRIHIGAHTADQHASKRLHILHHRFNNNNCQQCIMVSTSVYITEIHRGPRWHIPVKHNWLHGLQNHIRWCQLSDKPTDPLLQCHWRAKERMPAMQRRKLQHVRWFNNLQQV